MARVFGGDKIDGRTALGKALAAGTIECKRPYENKLPAWLSKRARHHKVKLARDATELLTRQVGPDLAQLDMHLQKLATLVGRDGTITAADVASVVGHDRLVDVFKLTDAVADGQPGNALETLHDLLAHGERVESVLGMLAWQFRRLCRGRQLLDDGVQPRQLASRLKVNAYFLDKFVRQARRFPLDALVAKQRLLHRTDMVLKTRSETDGTVRVMEELVVRLCL